MKAYLNYLRYDLPAGLVVFFMALPLCLGVALASGAPLFSGLVAGMIGGIVVAWASGSQLSVSGPAAGLTVIVFNAIDALGNFNGFLLSVVLAGCIQIGLGCLKAGIVGAFFPASVISGMLAAIGLMLFIKQIPHATGYDASFEGDESYMRETAQSSLFELFDAVKGITPAVTLVSSVALLILIAWETRFIKGIWGLRLIPGPLPAIIWGISYNAFASWFAPEWAIAANHLVSLPVLDHPSALFEQLRFPDFSYLSDPKVYGVAASLAFIASLEALLSLEAVDRLDPHKRIAPTNRELKAQGLGNIISGLLGGLPLTAVVVRSSANINAGAQTRIASFFHGLLLLLSVLFCAKYLNAIPMACLAAILLQTAYKLARPKVFLAFYKKGWNQFLPFTITVAAILLTDLLQGIAIGMVCGFFFVLKTNFHSAITLTQHGTHYLLRFHKDATFLNKALLRKYLAQVANNSDLIIDAVKAEFIDHDIKEAIADFLLAAPVRNINVELNGIEPGFERKK